MNIIHLGNNPRKIKSQNFLISNNQNKNYFNQYLYYKNYLETQSKLDSKTPTGRKDSDDSSEDFGNIYSKSKNMLVIEEFLSNLETKMQNQSNVVKTFENFLKSQKWPNYNQEEIHKLFFGEDNRFDTYLKGLLEQIGQIEDNPLGSESCLFLLDKLLDYEFNPDCEKYINVLKGASLQMLGQINLNYYLNSPKSRVKQAIKQILNSLYDERTSFKLRKLLGNAHFESFIEWSRSRIIF